MLKILCPKCNVYMYQALIIGTKPFYIGLLKIPECICPKCGMHSEPYYIPDKDQKPHMKSIVGRCTCFRMQEGLTQPYEYNVPPATPSLVETWF